MKTKAQVLRDYLELKTVINAVINRVGMDNVENINNHGIDGGYSGFIYNSETHQFAMRHRKTIVKMLEDTANDMGEDVIKMVSSFGIFRNSTMDNDDKKDLYRYLGGARCEQSTITNLMAWFAAEEVCRLFED
jgi:hypothetical protein